MKHIAIAPHPMQPRRALRSLGRLMENPEETEHVFHIIRDLSGNAFERLFRRVIASPEGLRVLERDNHLLATLSDRDQLRNLPAGTLGHTYARFVDAEHISADGLVDASERRVEDGDVEFLDPRAEKLADRLRDMHDLWHVVTGYGRDLVGEASLLAFTFAQTGNPGIALIVLLATFRMWKGGGIDGPGVIWEGFRRGMAAGLLPAADWEALLALPLADVRAKLQLGDPPTYLPLGLAEAEELRAAEAA